MAEEEKTEGGSPEAATEKGRKTKLIVMIVAISLIVIGGGVGAMFFLMSSDSSSDKSSASTGDSGSEGGSENSPAATEAELDENSDSGDDTSESGGDTDSQSSSSSGSKKQEDGDLKINIGATFTFKPFHLNLGNPLENRYIRLEIAMQYKGGDEQLKELEARRPQLRDAVLSVSSRKTREFLLGPDGKDQLRLELLNKVNQYMERKVEAIYITDMIIE